MEREMVGGLILGFLFGMLAMILFISMWLTNPLLTECELNLPRTQHCVLTAVPEKEKNHD